MPDSIFDRLPALADKGELLVLIVEANHAARLADQMAGMATVDCVSSGGKRAGEASGEALALAIT